MSIVAKIRIATALVLAMVVTIGVVLGVSTVQVGRAIRWGESAERLVRGVFELDTLTREYVADHGARPGTQWEWRYASLGALLDTVETAGGGDAEVLSRLRRSHGEIGRLFRELVAGNRDPLSRADPELAAERERQLVGQLITHEKAVIGAAGMLQERNHRRLMAAQKAQAVLVLVAGLVAMGAVGTQLLLIRLLVFRPLHRLRAGIDSVGRGQLDHRVGIRSTDEIGELSGAFDRMAQNLRAITASRDELNREVAERTRAERALAESNETLRRQAAELEAVNRELEAFSYSVSHDLRAPLRSIEGFSRAVVEDCADTLDETAREYLGRVQAATARMTTLIDDLLRLSRVSRAEMSRETVDLSALARAAIAELRQAHPDRVAEAVVSDGLRAEGDPRLLAVVVQNLVGNAWKFTAKRDGARIEVGAQPHPDRAPVFFVKDNGAGFDMQYADKLFAPFARLHPVSEYPGSGIGLATVQRIVARHGGRVWAEGQPGVGAMFYFTLSAGAAPGRGAARGAAG